jgi:hypothetical protein
VPRSEPWRNIRALRQWENCIRPRDLPGLNQNGPIVQRRRLLKDGVNESRGNFSRHRDAAVHQLTNGILTNDDEQGAYPLRR